MKTILVTGGLGFIGSHTCVELCAAGFKVVIIDNLDNSHIGAYERVVELTGCDIEFYHNDLMDLESLERIFQEYDIYCVIHFAGLKSVGESVRLPLKYYGKNIGMTLNLLEVMDRHGCRKLIFSSSATVYGQQKAPVFEDSLVGVGLTNPYGQTKYMIEQILRDVWVSDDRWSIVLLRYFNPIGAHSSGRIGEDPSDIPNNLMPYVLRVAVGEYEKLSIFGGDYNTVDGTGVRDYIHVVDLSNGHVKAVGKLEDVGVHTYNLGTGKGTSVLELVNAFVKVTGVDVNYEIVDRRPGDLDAVFADVSKAATELGWVAKRTVEDACLDGWRWQSGNPTGYRVDESDYSCWQNNRMNYYM